MNPIQELYNRIKDKLNGVTFEQFEAAYEGAMKYSARDQAVSDALTGFEAVRKQFDVACQTYQPLSKVAKPDLKTKAALDSAKNDVEVLGQGLADNFEPMDTAVKTFKIREFSALEERIAGLERELAAEKAKPNGYQQRIAQLQAQLDGARESLGNIQQREANVAARQGEIERNAGQLDAREKELQRREGNIGKRENEVGNREANVAKREQQPTASAAAAQQATGGSGTRPPNPPPPPKDDAPEWQPPRRSSTQVGLFGVLVGILLTLACIYGWQYLKGADPVPMADGSTSTQLVSMAPIDSRKVKDLTYGVAVVAGDGFAVACKQRDNQEPHVQVIEPEVGVYQVVCAGKAQASLNPPAEAKK